MFSGKSEELIRRLRRAMIARKRVEVFKPAIDDRYSNDEIVSHGDLRMKSQVVARRFRDHRPDRLALRGGRHRRGQFHGPQTGGCGAATGRQRQAGDYLRPGHGLHGPSVRADSRLLAHAESITKTLAICVRCGNPAKHTQRLRGSDDLIVVGASEMYEARCRRCFEPGIPKQTELDFVKAKRQNTDSQSYVMRRQRRQEQPERCRRVAPTAAASYCWPYSSYLGGAGSRQKPTSAARHNGLPRLSMLVRSQTVM